jgi:hypothetical protein
LGAPTSPRLSNRLLKFQVVKWQVFGGAIVRWRHGLMDRQPASQGMTKRMLLIPMLMKNKDYFYTKKLTGPIVFNLKTLKTPKDP